MSTLRTMEEQQRLLFVMIQGANDDQVVRRLNERLTDPVGNAAALEFELFALRAFVSDYIAYTVYARPEERAALCEPLFVDVRAYAQRTWDEGGKGLEQRLALYATALGQHPETLDTAILSMFCKLCQRSDEPFLQAAPELLLEYVKEIRGILVPTQLH